MFGDYDYKQQHKELLEVMCKKSGRMTRVLRDSLLTVRAYHWHPHLMPNSLSLFCTGKHVLTISDYDSLALARPLRFRSCRILGGRTRVGGGHTVSITGGREWILFLFPPKQLHPSEDLILTASVEILTSCSLSRPGLDCQRQSQPGAQALRTEVPQQAMRQSSAESEPGMQQYSTEKIPQCAHS